MDERNESSSGMMIGIIAGGIILVVLILGGIGAAGWFFLAVRHDHVEFHDVAAHVEEAPPPVIIGPEPAALEGKAPGVPAQMAKHAALSKEAGRLLGVWEAIDPPTSATLDFKADGAVVWTKPKAIDAAATLRMTGRWELVEATGDQAKVRLTSADKKLVVEHTVEFQGNNHLTIRGPFPQNDAWVLKGGAGAASYERKPK